MRTRRTGLEWRETVVGAKRGGEKRARRRVTVLLAAALGLSVLPAVAVLPSTPAAASVAITNIGNQQPSLPWESHAQMQK